MTIIVSACLLGVPCRYDGKHKKNTRVISYLKGKEVLPICPEVLAGLKMPRQPAKLHGGDGFDVLSRKARVINGDRKDLTALFIKGASKAVKMAIRVRSSRALLKERSPSCGLRPVTGIFAALLKREGFTVISEEDI